MNQTQSLGERQPLLYSEAGLLGFSALYKSLKGIGYRILETLSLPSRNLTDVLEDRDKCTQREVQVSWLRRSCLGWRRN